MAAVDPRAVNLWTARCVPVVLIGVVGYATYVFVARLCVGYLLVGSQQQAGTVIALLVIYFVLMLLMATSYFRILLVVTLDPGFIPLGRTADNSAKHHEMAIAQKDESGGTVGRDYDDNVRTVNWHTDADSPGLEEFYTKDVFICEQDGRPKWCTECGTWKPDRTHHCSSVGRCVRKMDHFCPWVGGVIGENSFKFFIQFVSYTALYCSFLLAVMACYIHQQLEATDIGLDPQFAAILGLATFFGLFTFGMTCSSVNFALTNLTTIENIDTKTKAWQLAVYISDPQNPPVMGPLGPVLPMVTYPLPVAAEESSRGSDHSDSSTVMASEAQVVTPMQNRHAERDSKATRTFAILRMEPGRNPWDLGPAGNWKSVMGNNILDWLLPINRSPICNHESAISQFPLGENFEKLKLDNGLETRRHHRRRSVADQKRKPRRSNDVEMQKYNRPP